jgi:hypothetical protein
MTPAPAKARAKEILYSATSAIPRADLLRPGPAKKYLI